MGLVHSACDQKDKSAVRIGWSAWGKQHNTCWRHSSGELARRVSPPPRSGQANSSASTARRGCTPSTWSRTSAALPAAPERVVGSVPHLQRACEARVMVAWETWVVVAESRNRAKGCRRSALLMPLEQAESRTSSGDEELALQQEGRVRDRSQPRVRRPEGFVCRVPRVRRPQGVACRVPRVRRPQGLACRLERLRQVLGRATRPVAPCCRRDVALRALIRHLPWRIPNWVGMT